MTDAWIERVYADAEAARRKRRQERGQKRPLSVYLAGPIFGCTDEEANGWRDRARELLPAFKILDPMAFDYRGRESFADNAREIVWRDTKAVRLADFLLVNAQRPSWGTAMEVYLAAMTVSIHVVAFTGTGPVSPWITAHADVTPTLEEACSLIRGAA